MNLAIFSPSKNPYSETFIQAHKNRLPHTVFYYYGEGSNNIILEGNDITITSSTIFRKVYNHIFKKSYNISKWQGLIKSIKKNKIDLVLIEYGTHAHNLIELLKIIDIPFVVHFHGYDATRTDAVASTDNYSQVFKYASRIISVSKVMTKALLKLGCPKDKLVYNTYGPNPLFYQVKPNFTKQQFIAVGRFTDKKAPYYLILSFSKVVKKFPNALLIIAGKGVLRETCLNLIKHYNLEKNIFLPGVITPQKYSEYLSESLAFVQHSITTSNYDMEGTPLAILEASIAGLPILSTYHAGIPDIVVQNETGILVQEHDTQGMANAMIKLLNNNNIARHLGKNGKVHVNNNFSMERHIETLSALLKEVYTESYS